MMAIENLADKCRRPIDPSVEEMTIDERLNTVKVVLHIVNIMVQPHKPPSLSEGKTRAVCFQEGREAEETEGIDNHLLQC